MSFSQHNLHADRRPKFWRTTFFKISLTFSKKSYGFFSWGVLLFLPVVLAGKKITSPFAVFLPSSLDEHPSLHPRVNYDDGDGGNLHRKVGQTRFRAYKQVGENGDDAGYEDIECHPDAHLP